MLTLVLKVKVYFVDWRKPISSKAWQNFSLIITIPNVSLPNLE